MWASTALHCNTIHSPVTAPKHVGYMATSLLAAPPIYANNAAFLTLCVLPVDLLLTGKQKKTVKN